MEVLKLNKFIRRMLSRQLGRCWNHWEGLSQEFRRLRTFGYRMKNRTVMATFNSWIEAHENMLRLQKAASSAKFGELAQILMDTEPEQAGV